MKTSTWRGAKKAQKTGETEETGETEDGDHQILDSTSTVAKKPVAVSPQTRAIFNVYHNSIVGHMGQERTRQRLMDAEASGAIADPGHIPDKKQHCGAGDPRNNATPAVYLQ